MKLSKEELKQKINEVISDDELKISLLEDIEDSVDIPTEIDESEKVEKTVYDELEIKYAELLQKYKDRFLKGEEASEEKEEKEDDIEELQEEEVIDVKEI